jgi:mono/diheme cytochrome c family protein
MKFRLALLLILPSLILSACSFSLAADITPPPNYKSPTPAPTLGSLFPASAPVPEQGAFIYAEKCAPCHGEKGLGDGPQSQQLPNPVPAIGVPEIARQAIPADWYTTITQGRMDRFMPPFSSLAEGQRWDVIAYVLALSTTPEQIAQGKSLYESNCASCHGMDGSKVAKANFTDQSFMAKRSQNDLFRTISQGFEGAMPAFDNLPEDERWAVTVYVRTLTFAESGPAALLASTSTPQPVAVTPAGSTAEPGTPSVNSAVTSTLTGEAPSASTPAMGAGIGTITGKVVYGSGGTLPAGLTVKLRGFDHGQNATSAPLETLDLEVPLQADGSFVFNNVEMPQGRFFIAEVEYAGLAYQSEIASVESGKTEVTFAPLSVFDTTDDFSQIAVSQAHVLLDFTNPGAMQVVEFYILDNTSAQTVLVTTDGNSLPFIDVPAGATNDGYQLDQGGAQFIQTQDGFALPPSTQEYGVIAGFSLPYDKKLALSIPFKVSVSSGSLLVPEGLVVKGDQLTPAGTRDMGTGGTFQIFQYTDLKVGDTLDFTISGAPKQTGTTATGADSNRNLLIGVGVLGVVLVLAGVFLFVRDRRREEMEDEEFEEASDEDADALMDAIIALDDQFRAGNISEEAYRQRRAELKARLKEKL